MRLAKRSRPFAGGGQPIPLVGRKQPGRAFALAEPSTKRLSLIPADVHGGMVGGILKPSCLPVVGCSGGKRGVIATARFPNAEPRLTTGQRDELHPEAIDENLFLVNRLQTLLKRCRRFGCFTATESQYNCSQPKPERPL